MKRFILLFLTAAALLAGCAKNTGIPYSFVDEFGIIDYSYSTFKGQDVFVTCIITIKEYKGDQCIKVNKINNPQKGERFSFYAMDEAEYLTVREYTAVSPKSDVSATIGQPNILWIMAAFPLVPGKETAIKLTYSTDMSVIEPIR